MRPRMTHVAVLARDIDASVDFYRRFAGLEEVHRRVEHGVTVVWLGHVDESQPFVVVLIAADHADVVEPAPLAHFGYAVGSREEVDLRAAMAREEHRILQEPMDAGPIVGYFTMVKDPDGNWVEFSYGQSLGEE